MNLFELNSLRHWLWTAAAVFAVAAVIGCGGSDEPRVTVWRELLGPPPIGAFPASNASSFDEAQLNAQGVRTSNKRCTKDSGLFGGKPVSYLDGIVPRYVLFDVPESEVDKAKTLYYLVYTPDMDWLSKPFWDCSIEGY